MKVKVYFNLHKKLFSVVALEGDNKGKVIDHVSSIDLSYPIFRVQKAGRDRVLKEKKKNVHAYIAGYTCKLKSDEWIEKNGDITWVKASYNPYKNKSFVSVDKNIRVSHCRYARLSLDKGLRVSDDYVWHKDYKYRFSKQ